MIKHVGGSFYSTVFDFKGYYYAHDKDSGYKEIFSVEQGGVI